MSMFKVGAKVRIQPQYLKEWLHGTPERGHTVDLIGDKNALLACGVAVPWERLAPDIDLPYDPKPPHKTLAEKELEVLQQDPVRRRWQELLGPEPEFKVEVPFNTGDFELEYILDGKRVGITRVKNENSPFIPPGEYVIDSETVLEYAKQVGITTDPREPGTLKKWAKLYEDAPRPRRKTLAERVAEEVESKKEPVGGDLKSGDRVHDAYYPRAGTVLKTQPAFDNSVLYKVEWDGPLTGCSLRPRHSLRTEAEQAAENERLRTYFAEKTPGFNPNPPAPQARPFKAGDRVRDPHAESRFGTIAILTNLFIEVQWDTGGKTTGAYDPSVPASWFEHAGEEPPASRNFQVGDRVRCLDSRQCGGGGTVELVFEGLETCRVRWDNGITSILMNHKLAFVRAADRSGF